MKLLSAIALWVWLGASDYWVGASSQHLHAPATHFVSARLSVLQETFLADGWYPLDPVCLAGLELVDGKSWDMGFMRLDTLTEQLEVVTVWRLPSTPRGLPLWALQSAYAGTGVASSLAHLTVNQTLLRGIALARVATPQEPNAPVPWVEIRHASDEIDGLISPSSFAVCGEAADDNECWVQLPPILPLRAPLPNTVLWRDNGPRKLVALTFDACSTFTHGEYNRAVIDQLLANHIPATLFVGGHWAESHPSELMWLAAQPGFEIGNHTYSHPHMTQLSVGQQRQELLWTQYIIYSLTGLIPRYFRPPYGEIDDSLIREVAQLGLYTVEFDLPAGDADMHVSDERLIEWIMRKASAGSIVVMHMNHPGSKTAEVLPTVAKQLRAKGYAFAKISDMVMDDP